MKRYGLMLALLLPVIALAQTEFRGQTPGGAFYRVMLPSGWTPGAGLVLFHHGFNAEPVGENPDFGPLLSLQLNQGHAVAASAFSQAGWSLTRAIDDNLELIARFRAQFGEPGPIYSYGGSMGGLIAVKLGERTPLKGILSLCAPLAGARNWERAFDLRLTYDQVCSGVGGGELERGSAPYPWALDLNQIPTDLGDLSSIQLLRLIARLNQCTGVNLPPVLRTPPMRDRLSRLQTWSGISSEDYFVINMGYSVYALSDLLRQPDKLNGRNPFDSRFVDYGVASINSGIARVASDPFARLDFARQSSLQGPFFDAPIVSLHTNRDELVDWRNAHALTPLVAPSRLSQAFVRETEVAHCRFNRAEGAAAWDALKRWSNGGVQPTSASLQADCTALASGPNGGGPCRIDASLTPGPIDAKFLPRKLDHPALDERFSGIWWNPNRAGEGWVVEVLEGNQALLYHFSYPAPGLAGSQAWFGGVGKLIDGALDVDPATITRGARFGAAFRPQDVQTTNWGRLSFVPTRCGEAEIRAIGRVPWGTQTLRLEQLTQLGAALPCNGSTPLVSHPLARYAGLWFDPARNGEGVALSVDRRGNAVLGWYTYDLNGEQLWISATATPGDGGFEFSNAVLTSGARYGASFDPAQVTRKPFGQITLKFETCGRARFQVQPIVGGYDALDLNYQRLTRPLGAPACLN
jgi:hypothetical protein